MERSREVRGLGSNTRRLECYAPPFHKRLGDNALGRVAMRLQLLDNRGGKGILAIG